MRIDNGIRAPYVVDLSSVASARPKGVRQQGSAADRVEISQQGKELARLKKELGELPDVRLERVALARQQMQYGPYRIDPVLVAQKMMKEQPLQGDDL
ncbi:flagellar biosynthesis anti-sigma factor FlgM [Geomonas sp. RF6]|uniref:flagellar biosynthesis anti-sigma factor FlgM n=1 Tax=Geomonas sp. RF6 TaxID=2897342 RepID=UPI001E282762|nr:flagellar biosynthesis anti-sigma factor FlgM [Geomonas sp. RF6]UFS72407.1 flagellar biosynthesis anti-sigma factor FlgM [Geomonas sp. RF6]